MGVSEGSARGLEGAEAKKKKQKDGQGPFIGGEQGYLSEGREAGRQLK